MSEKTRCQNNYKEELFKLKKNCDQSKEQLHQALAELKETRQQLIDQERQHAFLQLASGIAHDFNNSLASILGYSDLLVHEPELLNDQETSKRFIKAIHSAASHASETVRRHFGKLEIDSEQGKGTIVRIKLPVSKVGKSEARPKVSKSARQHCKPRRILIIEDDKTIHDFLRKTCDKSGHLVDIADTPESGLQKFYSGWYDLVITSRVMPEMNGDKLAAIIKATSNDKPVIMLTGYGDIMLDAGDKPPAVDIIVAKPVTADSFLRALDKAFEVSVNPNI